MTSKRPPGMSRSGSPAAMPPPLPDLAYPQDDLVASITKTLDQSDFKKRVLYSLISSPWTLLPFLAGVSVLLVIWALSIVSGPVAFVGVSAILGSAGAFLTRYFLGKEALAKRIVAQMETDVHKEREKSLDELDSRLSRLGDNRPRAALRDLRALMKAFHEGQSWSESMNASSTFDILSKVDELAQQCVMSLHKTMQLSAIVKQMTTPEAKEPILQHREQLIKEVFESVGELGKILVSIQSLQEGSGSDTSELARIRKDLDQSIEVAHAVEKRMRQLDREINGVPSVESETGRTEDAGSVQ